MLPDPGKYASKLTKTEDLAGFGPILMDLRLRPSPRFWQPPGYGFQATIHEFENSEVVLIIVMAS